jgi:predicted enzyme related to lactoylglutathione lyase
MNQEIESMAIGIATSNVKEAAAWYQSLFGNLEMIEPVPGTIELKLTDTVWLQLDDTGYLAVGGSIVRFETKDIDTAHKRVKELTSDLEDIETVEGVVKFFEFKDPAGNRLSYYQVM